MKIAGHIYTLSGFHGVSGSPLGETNLVHHTMNIDLDISKSEQESTVLHEVIETISKNCELGICHQTICTLENNLYAFFTDNGIDLSLLIKELHHDEMRILRKRSTPTRAEMEEGSPG
jgi:hypothetical protein